MNEHLQPLTVSVVVVCYNQARYLADAIESVLAQTHRRLETILIDDGSTDDTAQVARRFPGVRYLRQENQGLSAARNAGLRAARGEYILFLDADDRLKPEAVQAGLKCFRGFPTSAFVCGAYCNIFVDGSAAPTDPQQRVHHQHYLHLLEGNFIGMHGAVLYRREVLLEAGGFNESLKACEDYDVYLRLARRHTIAQHGATVAEYRQHDSNMSRDYALMLRSALGVLEGHRALLKSREERKAYRNGVKAWREYYLGLRIARWKESRRLSELPEVARMDPGALLRRVARRILPSRDRHLSPVSEYFGFDRGQPVDRYYIEDFLAGNAGDIQGHVLEIGDDAYSRRYGGRRITRQDVLHIEPGFPGATIVADLSDAPQIPDAQFDCIILTQTLNYIFDLQGAVGTLARILKPGGTLLVTLPGISRLCTDQADKESDCWRFTVSSARRLFAAAFGESRVEVRSYGNVFAATAFLCGYASHELRRHELEYHDPNFPVTITVAAVKAPKPYEPASHPFQNDRALVSPDRAREPGSLVAVRYSSAL